MKNLTLENITNACQGTFHGDPALLPREITGITIDSRKVEKDYLFVAIDGERFNAHTFIPETIEKGALCVVSHEDLGETDFPYILVDATGQALLDIAKLYRDSFEDIKVVGITGSVGKTSTKEMVASVLSQKYKVHKTKGNFNNECGLPLTIFEMDEEHEVSVLEMGINHFGEMRKLSFAASPDICLITNIGVAHLEFLKTQEGIMQEKTQMFQDMKTGGSIILNGDDPLLSTLGPVKGAVPKFYGTTENCDYHVTDLKPLGLKGTACTMHLPSGSFSCVVPSPGAHMVSNALAGAAVGDTLGLTMEEIKEGIEHLPFIPGRNNIIQTNDLIILDDCYNANPVSMRASIDVLTMGIGRKIAILGDMGELGKDEKPLHYDVGEYAADCGIDLVCAIGSLAKEIAAGASDTGSHTEALWFQDKQAFLEKASTLIRPGDNILVKASHGMEFPELVDALKEL